MTTDLAISVTNMRLLQTAKLLEWLIENESSGDSLRKALASVLEAHAIVDGLGSSSSVPSLG